MEVLQKRIRGPAPSARTICSQEIPKGQFYVFEKHSIMLMRYVQSLNL